MTAPLKKFTADELRAELARREAAMTAVIPTAPLPLEKVNWSAVYECVQGIVRQGVAEKRLDEDRKTWVYEAVMQAVYGEPFWAWCRRLGE